MSGDHSSPEDVELSEKKGEIMESTEKSNKSPISIQSGMTRFNAETLCLIIVFLGLLISFVVLIVVFVSEEHPVPPPPPPPPPTPQITEEEARQRQIVECVNNRSSLWLAVYNPDSSSPNFTPPDTSPCEKHAKFKPELLKFDSESANQKDYLDEQELILPVEFEPEKKWPYCNTFHVATDQAGCGSCWAVAATGVMTDRVCIATKGKHRPRISTEDLLTCCTGCPPEGSGNGCNGGWLEKGFEYWTEEGVVTGGPYGSKYGCKSYHKPPNCGSPCHTWLYREAKTAECVRNCTANTSLDYMDDKYYGNTSYKFNLFPMPENPERDPSLVKKVMERRELMKKELYLFGPVTATIFVREDFQHYKSGIYGYTAGSMMYGHSVKVVGWGKTKQGVEFWKITNSWGPSWGENGTLRIEMNELPSMEAGQVNLTRLPYSGSNDSWF